MLYIGRYCLIPEFGCFAYCQTDTDTVAAGPIFECVLMTLFFVRVELIFKMLLFS